MITWVPSKKAIESGLPTGFDPATFNIDESAVPAVSSTIMMTRTYRHMLNNEATSAWLAERDRRDAKAKENGGEPDTGNDARIDYLDKWRRAKMAEILDGRLGMREPSEVVIVDPVEKVAKNIAFNRVRDHVLGQKGNFPYTVINAKSLAFVIEDGKQNATVGDWIDRLLDPATPRGKKIWDDAAAQVEREKAESAADDLSNMFDDAA